MDTRATKVARDTKGVRDVGVADRAEVSAHKVAEAVAKPGVEEARLARPEVAVKRPQMCHVKERGRGTDSLRGRDEVRGKVRAMK